MSLLDNILPEKSHDDIQKVMQDKASSSEEEIEYEHNFAIRITSKVVCDAMKKGVTVEKGKEICDYFEMVFEGASWFKLLRTRSTVKVNCIDSAILTTTLIIGYNGRPHYLSVFKLLMTISTAMLHYNLKTGITITISDLNYHNDKHRISARKIFDAPVILFILNKLYADKINVLKLPDSIKHPYKTVCDYYQKNNIRDDDHYIPPQI